MKSLLGFILISASALAQLPNAPVPQPKPAHFFTFRGSWQAPPLRTNRQSLESKTFLLLHGALLAAVIVDVRHTHAARENYPSELPAVAAVTGMDYLMDRFVTRSFSVEAPVYGIQHYVRDALK